MLWSGSWDAYDWIASIEAGRWGRSTQKNFETRKSPYSLMRSRLASDVFIAQCWLPSIQMPFYQVKLEKFNVNRCQTLITWFRQCLRNWSSLFISRKVRKRMAPNPGVTGEVPCHQTGNSWSELRDLAFSHPNGENLQTNTPAPTENAGEEGSEIEECDGLPWIHSKLDSRCCHVVISWQGNDSGLVPCKILRPPRCDRWENI